MCHPAVIVGVQALGGGIQAIGQLQQGRATEDVARRQARYADLQAGDALNRGRLEELRFRRGLAQLQGRQRVAAGASGTTLEGSPADIFASTAELGELDALTIRANAEREAYGFTEQARLLRYSGRVARRQSQLGALGTLLGTASQAGRQGAALGLLGGGS
jgi:hypothetical protein